MPEDKPNFALLIGKGKPKEDGMPPEKEGGEKESMEMSAVSDLIDAVHMKDPQMVKQALKDFIEICYPELGESPEEEAGESASEEAKEPVADDGGY